METTTEYLFSYGTLQSKSVQLKIVGRELKGQEDKLPGYKLEMIEITDEAVIASSGKKHHPIIKYTGNKNDCIEGTTFKLTKKELSKTDDYEVDDYKRIAVELKSGTKAWAYVAS